MATAANHPPEDDDWQELTPDEAWAMFDEAAHHYLGTSGEEFLRAWDAGQIDLHDPERHLKLINVWMLLPLVREVRHT